MAVAGVIVGKTFITLMVNGTVHNITDQHPNYAAIREAIKTKQTDDIESLINIGSTINKFGDGKVTVVNGRVIYNDEELHGTIVDRIMDMIHEGFDAAPMLAFLGNLMQNPSKRAVDELYLWLEKTSLPITEDGHFLAYKRVREDFKDFYTGTMDNSVGQVVEMPRNKVDDNRDKTCSYGLHFCSLSYLPNYYGNEGNIVIVKINPADVVSIPADYNNAKGRACRYEVIGLHNSETTEAFDKTVWVDPNKPDETVDENEMYNLGFDDGNDASYNDLPYEPTPPVDEVQAALDAANYRKGYAEGWHSAVTERFKQ